MVSVAGFETPLTTSAFVRDDNTFAFDVPLYAIAHRGSTSANTLSITNPGTDKLKVTINKTSGLFTGSFIYSGQKKASAFGGVLFQDVTNGGGFFLGPVLSGTGNSGSVNLTRGP